MRKPLATVLSVALLSASLNVDAARIPTDIPSSGNVETVLFNEVEYSETKTVFHLNAPKTAKIRIYATASASKPEKTVKMKKIGTDRWEATVKGDLKHKFYTFDIGEGETPGTFAKAVAVNGRRGAIVDMRDTDPEGWDNDFRPQLASPADLVIYEMHHRDFSIDKSSGLKNKGKFLALTEPKAVAHLQSLGVNAVHILPSFDFATIDETKLEKKQYNWGYDPLNYNVPEGSYSTDPATPETRIREFKRMVQSLHKAGIRVILDVVYNHCNDIKTSNFQRTYPDYYYRMANDGKGTTGDIGSTGGKFSNGSGCGNETASEKPLMREFMKESFRYWAEEYHIDGFRVDLMGIHDIETMNIIRADLDKVDPSIFIYGEGWSAGTCAYPTEKLSMKANTRKLDRIAAFSDDMRDALRGPFSDDTKGAFLSGLPGSEESLKFGIVGAISHPQVDMTKVNYSKAPWTNSPAQQISYVSCHDDMCLVDRLKTSIPNITLDELIRLDLLAQTAVFTSQGVPFMLSGEEMLRDKKGVHNSYNSPDSINHLDWSNLEKYPQVFNYYSNIIRMRRNHKVFRMGDASLVQQNVHFIDTPDCVVAYELNGQAVGDTWKKVIVVLNSNKESKTVSIPQGHYTVVCRNIRIDENGFDTVEGSEVTVPAQSALIIKM